MKLRYGDHFGSRAGSTWRLIFVYSLMPWLNKYRITRKLQSDEEVTEETVRFFSVRNIYGEDGDENEEEKPSSLMAQFKSLRTSYVPEEQDKLPAPANLMRRSLTGKSSKRASLLLKELESERVDNLVKEKTVELHGQVADLQDQVERLTTQLQEKESTEVVYHEKGSSASSSTQSIPAVDPSEESTGESSS